MLNEKLLEKINSQINFEFLSSQLYLAMAGYCADIDLDGFTNFFTVQAEEEKFHAMKFFNYVNQMSGRIHISGMPEFKNEYESLLDVFKASLAHEKIVTRRIYELADIATEERDHATLSLLRWFIDEQVEEEANFTAIIKKLERIGNDTSALYMLDAQLATRVFTPPTNA